MPGCILHFLHFFKFFVGASSTTEEATGSALLPFSRSAFFPLTPSSCPAAPYLRPYVPEPVNVHQKLKLRVAGVEYRGHVHISPRMPGKPLVLQGVEVRVVARRGQARRGGHAAPAPALREARVFAGHVTAETLRQDPAQELPAPRRFGVPLSAVVAPHCSYREHCTASRRGSDRRSLRILAACCVGAGGGKRHSRRESGCQRVSLVEGTELV